MTNEKEARQSVADTGRILLHEGLVARTWGNISCRIDEVTFAITPSGLGYETMTAEDVVIYEMEKDAWCGTRKPSSEKGVHIEAYRQFPDAGFVIHTHQTYASALGLAGFESISLTDEEARQLNGIALAKYGLPGTKHLKDNVAAALSTGAHAVLMAQHGALIIGESREDAYEKVKFLENACKRACLGLPQEFVPYNPRLTELTEKMRDAFPQVACTCAPAVLKAAQAKQAFRAQLDDMAQMIGAKLGVVKAEPEALKAALSKKSAVLVAGLGAVCHANTQGDCDALLQLVEKACVGFLHTQALHVSAALSPLDTALMRMVYMKKYSKKIGG